MLGTRFLALRTWWQTRRLHWQRDVHSTWSETGYLAANPDVAASVAKGGHPDGWTHFVWHGAAEKRKWWSGAQPSHEIGSTRLCLDPWTYAEVSATGGVRPCCNYQNLENLSETDADAVAARDRQSFRQLRAELLEGRLSDTCQRCHIRERTQTGNQRLITQVALARAPDADGLLRSGPLSEIRIDLNERCNLRCVYCAVSQPQYSGKEMSEQLFAKCEQVIAGQKGPLKIALNGHGETTYHSRWVEYAERLLRYGHAITITTNLAKRYDDRELAALARFSVIQISLDSANESLMREVRRHVALRNIVRNIQAIRDKAQELKGPQPAIGFSTGVYDPSVWELEQFVDFLIANEAQFVTFWNLVEYPPLPEPAFKVQALDRLSPEKKREAKALIERVRQRLHRHEIGYQFAGDFRDADGFSYI